MAGIPATSLSSRPAIRPVVVWGDGHLSRATGRLSSGRDWLAWLRRGRAAPTADPLRELTDALPVMVAVVDADHRYEFVNAQHAKLHGGDPSEVGGRHLRDALGEEVYEAIRPQVEEALAGQEVRFERSFPARDGGGQLSYETVYRPRRSRDGVVTGFYSHSINVTSRRRAERERRAMEQQMLRSQKLEGLGSLAGGIAHDFNNLLGSVIAHVDLVRDGLERDADVAGDLEEVRSAALRAAELCSQLLVYAGQSEAITEAVDLSQLASEMTELLEVSLGAGVGLDFDVLGGGPLVDGDATQLRQVLLNLIHNASEACEENGGGRVTLSTGVVEADAERLARSLVDDALPAGEYAYVEVVDSGVGMDEATRLKIFDPFFSTKFTGRGLGLAAVLGIVRGHGGAVELESEADVGTSFRVLLPVSRGPASSPIAEEPAASRRAAMPRAAGDAPTVLVVDDEPAIRRAARRILTRCGYQVREAENGFDAIAIVEAGEPLALVLLDLTMPEIDGGETYELIRERNASLPVLLCSGYSALDVKERLGVSEAPPLLEKPFSFDSLAEAVGEVISRG